MDHMPVFGDLSDDIRRRILGIHLDGPMSAGRRVVRHMLTRGTGSIINFTSRQRAAMGTRARPAPSPSTRWWA
jgi:hypothetical protein